MSGIYVNEGRIYFRVKVDGKWKGIRTEFKPGQERQARAMLDRLDARLAAGDDVGEHRGPPTVASWHPRWISARKVHVQTWKNDDAVMRLHVLPKLGHLRLDEVRPKHLVDLVRSWRARTGDDAMAPKSIYNAYSTVSAFFRDASLEDLIGQSPCVLTKHQLGPKVDADPEWRASAQYTRAELEQLVSDGRLPLDRRVYYALCGLAGLRYEEASGLHWRNAAVHVDAFPDALSMIHVAFAYERPFTKGSSTRPVPCHPALASLLAEWKLAWSRFFGRAPTPDDLVVPLPVDAASAKGRWRRRQWVRKHLKRDLEVLGLRHRRGHDLRRTFISLARSDGARTEILRRATHKPPREVIEGYTTFEWDVLCAEVAKLRVKRRDAGKVIAMPRAVAVNDAARGPSTDSTGDLATPLATDSTFSEGKQQWRSPDSNPGEATYVERGSGASTAAAPADSRGYGGPAGSTTDVDAVSAAASRSSVASGGDHVSALADLLQLGSAALSPDHPAMRRAAAALPPGWRRGGGES